MGSCESKPEAPRSYTLRMDHIPGISPAVAYDLYGRCINAPEKLWAEYVLNCANDIGKFAMLLRKERPSYPMFHILNCTQFLKEVSNIIERDDIRLCLAQNILRNSESYYNDRTTFESAEVFIRPYVKHKVDTISDMQTNSCEFIHNVMKYLRTGGTWQDSSFNAAFTRMMEERINRPPAYTYPPGYIHLPPYTERPTCNPPNDPLPEYSVV